MENTFQRLESRFRVLLDKMEQKQKVERDIVLTCVVLQSILRTQLGRLDRTYCQAGDITVIANAPVVYVPHVLQESFEGAKVLVICAIFMKDLTDVV